MATRHASDGLRERVRSVLDHHWVADGYTAPNPDRYPFRWLWDSCFHALLWAELGDERALVELSTTFAVQAPSGFVPHVDYRRRPDVHADFWGRAGTSSITQPPMYGHALAELARRGVDLPDELIERAHLGLGFLLRPPRRRPDGLVALCHPWESGADDSPRWDGWCAPSWDRRRWYDRKGELLRSVRYGPDGSPLDNPDFDVASAGFNALVAFNCAELAQVSGDRELAAEGEAVAAALDEHWDNELATWTDAGAHASSRARTLDALLAALVIERPEALAQVTDPAAFGGRFGPAGVHRAEPAFDGRGYWRGSSWPPLAYLLWLAARRWGGSGTATRLVRQSADGAVRSGFAEHWDPDDGTGLGAVPQSWAGLVLLMKEKEA